MIDIENMKYSEIIKGNKNLERDDKTDYKIAVLSNIMVHQSKDICEYLLRSEGINANIILGDYDNIVQDSSKFNNLDAVVIFWEIYNLIDGLQYKLEQMKEKEFEAIIQKTKFEMDIVFNNIKDVPLVMVNKFSNLIFNQFGISNNRFDNLTNILNNYLDNKIASNIKIIDIDKVISKISISKSIDLRYYYSSKTLYSIDFHKEYFKYTKPLFIANNGKVKKALIFDCDNTLWKGILGEDGFEKIKIFEEVQYLAKALSKQGVIIGLCSKNNPEDVDNAIEKHSKMILKDKDIVIKKVNWNDKASNLKTMAKELNIGLDSFVFLDDSNFEVNLIREELPMVKTFQVPVKEYEYSMVLREVANLFYNPTQTKEDLNKVIMYKNQIKRVESEQLIGNIEEYLSSLELKITTYIDDTSEIPRISQMTQKTNQFNLTTKRYTEKDIENFMKDENKTVLAIAVSDKFGDNGIVGLVILEYHNDLAKIDTLLMSCRVLGRNIEYKFMDIIINILKKKSILKIKSEYLKTLKNTQVSNLYDRYGFEILDKSEGGIRYRMLVKDYSDKKLDYIGVNYKET